MTPNLRRGVFLLAVSGFLAFYLWGLIGLPGFGHYPGPYGDIINAVAVPQTHATGVVSAVNFEYRAFDTLGEEFILFASVAGVALLLRHLRREEDGTEPSRSLADHQFAGASDALRLLSLILIPLLVSLGVYLALHGALTPGGGFQAGVVLAAGPLAILLAGRYLALKHVAPRWVLEALDSAGAAAYALIGLGGLVFASMYLENFLPLGTSGHLLSAGTMPLNSIAVGLEVSGAFLLTWTEFLDQDLLVERGELG